MRYVVDKLPTYTLIKLEERKVDSRISPDLKQLFVTLSTEGTQNIILDLSATEYIDSSGLSAILMAERLCNNLQGSLILTGLNPNVTKMLEISQLYDKLNIAHSVDDAIEAIHFDEIREFDANFNIEEFDNFDDEDFIDDVEEFDDLEEYYELDSEFDLEEGYFEEQHRSDQYDY